MTRHGTTRHGSLQFYPRKRADRILPRVNWGSIDRKEPDDSIQTRTQSWEIYGEPQPGEIEEKIKEFEAAGCGLPGFKVVHYDVHAWTRPAIHTVTVTTVWQRSNI